MKKAFTLIELLVVIAIIGILATAALLRIRGANIEARDSRRISDLSQLRTQLEHYDTKNGKYPTALSSLVPDYIKSVPKDPSTKADYSYGVNDNTTPTDYTLGSTLEDTSNPALSDDVDGTSNGISCDDPVYCVSP